MRSLYGCLLCVVAARAAAQDIGPYTPDEWAAVNVLQGAVRTPVIDSATVATTAMALRMIRDRYPEVRYATTGNDETVLDLILMPTLSATVARLNGRAFKPHTAPFDAARLDSGYLDSLNALYRVRRVRVEYFSGFFLVHEQFAVPVNVPYVAGAYRAGPGVRRAGQPVYVGYEGTDSHVELVIKRPFWHFIFVVDTWEPSDKTYYFTYNAASGSITPLADGSPSDIVLQEGPLWQRSGPASLKPYNSYAALIDATADTAWWVRRAAVEVLGFLFEHPQNPWGRDGGDTARYDALKDSVWVNHVAILHLLREAQHDIDDDVRDAASGALRKAREAGVTAD
jgi:hypothetical protein